MRVIPSGVLALSLVFSPMAVSGETNDEIDFNQDPIVTVEIDSALTANSTGNYRAYAYGAVGLAGVYAAATWKFQTVRTLNSYIWNKFCPSFLKAKKSE